MEKPRPATDKAALAEADIPGAARPKTQNGTATRDPRTRERGLKRNREQALRYARWRRLAARPGGRGLLH